MKNIREIKAQLVAAVIAQKRILFGLVLALVIGAYLGIEVLMLLSYRSQAKSNLSDAIKYSNWATLAAFYLYPSDSKRFHDIFIDHLKIVSGADAMVTHTSARSLVASRFYEIKGFHPRYDHSEINTLVSAARIQNGSAWATGEDITHLISGNKKMMADLEKDSPILAAKLREEDNFSALNFYASLHPTTEKIAVLNEEWEVDLQKKHDLAIKEICAVNKVDCRFYEARWRIGKFVRHRTLNKNTEIPSTMFLEITNFSKSGLCRDLSFNECYTMQENLSPYYYAVVRLLGER